MTPADHALVQNILDDPLNDGIEGPRGVYADWLDERGHGNDRERAAFIRDQIYGEYVEPKVEWIEDMARTIYGPSAKPCVDYGYSGGKNGVTWEWVRGFPAQLSCTLATLFGGECGTCNGQRGRTIQNGGFREFSGSYPTWEDCSICQGTGRTEGIARGVFSRWPITEVMLTDRELMRDNSPYLDVREFWWVIGDIPPWIPEPLWNLVATGPKGRRIARTYPSRDAALAALSRAAVNYGRERAGLRPIAWVNS